MRSLSATVPVLILACAAAMAQAPAAGGEITTFERTLTDAIRAGDRPALERLVANGFTIIHSTGVMETKKEYLDAIAAAASAQRAPDIEQMDSHFERFGDHTVVATHRAVIHGRGDGLIVRSTEVYVKGPNGWQWAASQSTSLPVRPKAAVTMAAASLAAYAGDYKLPDGRTLTIRVDEAVLRAQLRGFRDAELIPESETEFAWFNPDVNLSAQLVFVRDGGRITHAFYRRDGREIWRAVKVH